MSKLRIVSLNVRGLLGKASRHTGIPKWQYLYDELKDYDIICFQEIRNPSLEEMAKIERFFKCKIYWNVGSPNSEGTAVIVNTNVISNHSCVTVEAGTIQNFSFEYGGQNFQLWNVYASRLNDLNEWAKRFVRQWTIHSKMILVGDWNSVENPALDRKGQKQKHDDSCMSPVWQAVTSNGFYDSWRERNLNSQVFSYYWPNVGPTSRLDRVYANAETDRFIWDIGYLPNKWYSDHCAVWFELQKPDFVRWGRSFWKCNVSHLKDPDLRKKVANFWQYWTWQKAHYQGRALLDWWEQGKRKLQYILRGYATQKAKLANQCRENQLNKQLEQLQTSTSSEAEEKLVRAELYDIATRRLRGTFIRSRLRQMREDHGSCEWYKRVASRKGDSRSILALSDANNQIKEDQPGVLEEAKRFYQNLYTRTPTDVQEQQTLLQGLNSRLSEEDKQKCEGFISEAEVFKALKSMRNGKTPGLDGLPKEFYLQYWDIIGTDLVQVLNTMWLSESMPPSMAKAIITLLYKKGDARQLKNWRPISLLTIDYKILSKILAKRLSRVISKVVFITQTCGVAGRGMRDNLIMIRSVLEYVKHKESGVFLSSFDFEKAFDRVDHAWMLKVLHAMNFGPMFTKWIKILYKDIGAFIEINGALTETVSVERGIRQGCPVSMLLFVLQAEPLLAAVRQNQSIRGCQVPLIQGTIDLKVLSYADDNTFLLRDPASLEALTHQLERFCRASGAKINEDKTEVVPLGKIPNCQKDLIPKSLLKKQVKVLGVYIGKDSHKKNWKEAFQNISAKMASCEKKHLNLFDRVRYVNTYVLSKLYHILPFDPPKKEDISKIESRVGSFLWNYPTWRPISRDTLGRPPDEGGLALQRLEQRTQTTMASLIREYVRGNDPQQRRMWWGLTAYFIGLAPTRLQQICPGGMSNLMPHVFGGAAKNAYFRLFLATFEKCEQTSPGLNWSKVSTRALYTDLVRASSKPVACEKNLPNVDWPAVWPEVLHKSIPAAYRLIAYKVLHSALPFKSQFSVPANDPCPLCKSAGMDSAMHLFWECSELKEVRDRIGRGVSAIKNAALWSWRTVLYNGALEQGLTERQECQVRILCSIYKAQLWHERCSVLHAVLPNRHVLDPAVMDHDIASKFQNALNAFKRKNSIPQSQ